MDIANHQRALEGNSGSMSPGLLQDSKRTQRTNPKPSPQVTDEFQPPHLIFEQGEILKCFPNLIIKQLILQIFNQKVMDVVPYTKSMQNDIIAISTYSAKDSEKPNRVKYFNFIINDEEEEDNYADKQNTEREPTVYQHIKQRNFAV